MSNLSCDSEFTRQKIKIWYSSPPRNRARHQFRPRPASFLRFADKVGNYTLDWLSCGQHAFSPVKEPKMSATNLSFPESNLEVGYELSENMSLQTVYQLQRV